MNGTDADRPPSGLGPSLVWVDYCHDGHGTVRIDIQDREHLCALIRAVRRLRPGKADSVMIHDLFPVVYSGLEHLRIGRTPGTGAFRKSVYRESTGHSQAAFLWSPTRDGWIQNVGLLLGQLPGPGHQYYGDDIDDDAEIEISYGEPHNAYALDELISSGQAIVRHP